VIWPDGREPDGIARADAPARPSGPSLFRLTLISTTKMTRTSTQ